MTELVGYSNIFVFHREHAFWGAIGHDAGERSESEAEHLNSSLPAGGMSLSTLHV